MRELEKGRRKVLPAKRSRRPGGGRKSLTFHNPDLLQALEKLVEPTTRGDPESPLRRPPPAELSVGLRTAVELAETRWPSPRSLVKR